MATGSSWSQSFAVTANGIPINATLNNTITAKGITKVVKGVTYNNVIVVEQKIEAEILPGIWQDISAALGSGKSYYARGLGLIKFELTSPFGNFQQELRRSQVF